MSVPLAAPQVASVVVIAIAVGQLVLLIASVVEKIQPLASVTSMVCDPAGRLLYTSVAVDAEPSTE